MKTTRTCELTRHVSLCSGTQLMAHGRVLTPDHASAFGECHLAHAFPVTTVDGTALHPQVVANSFHFMLWKVVDFFHVIKAYDPENHPRDYAVGTVIDVEFPRMPEGGWKLETDRAKAPGIRAVFAIHRQLEQAEMFVQSQISKVTSWTVSMEHNYDPETSGFLIAGRRGVEQWEESTPEELRKNGFVYVPFPEAPAALRECFDESKTKILEPFRGQETTYLIGGLNGHVRFKGIGLTPIGKENEARLSQVLASGISYADVMGLLDPPVISPLRNTLNLLPA